jgi:hypothetical protein
MPLADRNILITPNRGASTEPNIRFTGADAGSSATITLRVLNSSTVGTLSFEGNAGQLFSISDTFAGTIFSVNDISGIPSIEVLDTGQIKLAQYSGYVSILGVTSATSTNTGVLRVEGGVGIGGNLYVGGTINGTASTATALANAITFNNAGAGVASGTTYNGSVARTISHNTIGAVALAGSTMTGNLTFTGGNGIYGGGSGLTSRVWAYDTSNPGYGIYYVEGTTDSLRLDVSGQAQTGTPDVLITPDTLQVNGNTVWHSGNDGASSGLDADTIDSIDSTRIIYGSNASGSNATSSTFYPYELAQYKSGFWDANGVAWTPDNGWWWGITAAHKSNTTVYNYSGQLIFNIGGTEAYFRSVQNGTAGTWRKIIHDGNTSTSHVGTANYAASAGSASGASGSVSTVLRTTNASHFLTFVDSNNASATAESIYTTSSVTVNPSTGEVDILSNLSASSTTTGALVVTGGAGIGRELYVGGSLQLGSGTGNSWDFNAAGGTISRANGQIQLIGGGGSTSRNNILIGNGSGITIFGGTGVALGGQIKLDGGDHNVLVSQNTASVSTTTGALVVTGGVGIGRDLYVGGTIFGNISGTLTGNAATVSTLLRTTNASHFLTFVDSNNASATAESIYTTSTLVVNPSTGNVGIGTSSPVARLQSTGAAQTATPTGGSASGSGLYINNTDAAYGMMFGVASTGRGWIQQQRSDSNIQYDISLNPIGGNIGVGVTTPQKKLDVVNGSSSGFVASFGSLITVGAWAGIHFGYSESTSNNDLYKKSGIVFERTDNGGGGGNAAGKVHILNGPATTSGSATLSDARVTISELGNVGIATTSPNFTLDVKGRIGLTDASGSRYGLNLSNWGYSSSYKALVLGSTSTSYNTNVTGSVTLAFNYDPVINSNSSFFGDGRELLFRRGSQFVTPNSANNSWYLSNLTLYDGNVGIGTVTPGHQLDIVDYSTNTYAQGSYSGGASLALRAAGTSTNDYSGIRFTNSNGSREAFIGVVQGSAQAIGDFVIQMYNAYTTSYKEVVRVQHDGNFIIGGSGSTTTNKFEIQGTSGQLFSVVDSFTGTIFSANDISGIPSIEVLDTGLIKFAQYTGQVAISTSTAQANMGLTVNSSTYVTSLGVGTVASGTLGEIRASNEITAYYSSDERLKENVKVISDPIQIIQQIRGVRFDWKNDYIEARGGEDGFFVRKHDVGVIAQEVESVLPEVVATRNDGYKAVKYEKIVALLIEAIKEQQITINTLKIEIENIKSQLK